MKSYQKMNDIEEQEELLYELYYATIQYLKKNSRSLKNNLIKFRRY